MTRIISENEKTPWYPRETKPARDGWYETRIFEHHPVGVLRRWWNGVWFENAAMTVACVMQLREWRGVRRSVK